MYYWTCLIHSHSYKNVLVSSRSGWLRVDRRRLHWPHRCCRRSPLESAMVPPLLYPCLFPAFYPGPDLCVSSASSGNSWTFPKVFHSHSCLTYHGSSHLFPAALLLSVQTFLVTISTRATEGASLVIILLVG